MMFKLLSAKRFAFLSRFAKNNMLRPISVFGLIAGSLFSVQAQATWNQVTGLASSPAAVAMDPNNVGTAYAVLSSNNITTLYRISSLNFGTASAQALTINNMNLSTFNAFAVKPKLNPNENDVILIAGEGPDLQSGVQSAPKVFMLTGLAGSNSYNATDISSGLLGQVGQIGNIGSLKQLLMTKTGNAYLVHSYGIHRASNITPASTYQTTVWTSVSTSQVYSLSVIETSTANTLISVIKSSAYGLPGVYAASESASSFIDFRQATGLLADDTNFIISTAVNSSTVSPGVYVSVNGRGLYNCSLSSVVGSTPTLNCTQAGVVAQSNELTVMAVNSSGTLFGANSQENKLKSTTTNASFWTDHELTLPTGYIKTDFFFVTGSAVVMTTESGLYSSLTNALPGTGTSGTTNGTDVEVQSVT
ncbi:MAG: hypothetical protein OEX19_09530, partial [Gammaproteobacteria bacterium]|nr:hypothetical protein [Gammaproteobacteria bacterium]